MHRNAQTCSRPTTAPPHDSRTSGINRWHTRCDCKLSLKGAFIMGYVKRITFVVAVVTLFVLASRPARADQFDQLMIITFSGPVQIPGEVLPAGTYQFKLAGPRGDRNVVEILSGDWSKGYAPLLTVPQGRAKP